MKKILKVSIAILGVSVMYQASAQEYIYKFKNGDSAIYTDRVPASEKREFTVMSSGSGTIKKVVGKELEQAEIEERDKLISEEKTAKIKASDEKRRDDILLQTYNSVEDIEKYREYELGQINQTIEASIDNIAVYKDRVEGLETIIKKTGNNKKAQDDLTKSRLQIVEIQKTLDSSKKLYIEKQNKYDEDKIRYKRVMEQLGQAEKVKNQIGVVPN